MRAWADVAELTNTKNLDGGLVARCAPGLPFLLREGMEVAFVPPVLDAPRRARVAWVRAEGGAPEGVVGFEDVEGIGAASPLVGCHCLVRRSDLPQDALAGAGAHAWAGFAVFDARAGFVGHVEGVREMPAQRLLEVARADAAGEGGEGGAGGAGGAGASGAAGEDATGCEGAMPARPAAPVLVPLVDALVVRVDEQARRIDVDLPDGLLDL